MGSLLSVQHCACLTGSLQELARVDDSWRHQLAVEAARLQHHHRDELAATLATHHQVGAYCLPW